MNKDERPTKCRHMTKQEWDKLKERIVRDWFSPHKQPDIEHSQGDSNGKAA
jgi:hypothetical protein